MRRKNPHAFVSIGNVKLKKSISNLYKSGRAFIIFRFVVLTSISLCYYVFKNLVSVHYRLEDSVDVDYGKLF